MKTPVRAALCLWPARRPKTNGRHSAAGQISVSINTVRSSYPQLLRKTARPLPGRSGQ